MNEHFKLNRGNEDALDLHRARRSVPLDFSQEMWDKCVELFDSKKFRVNY